MREYLLVFLAAGVASYLLCVFARELAIRSGAVARVRDRDVHATPIPYFGGVAMLGGLGAGLLVARHLPFLSTSQPIVFHDAGIVLLAGAMICAVGVVDDLIELDALTKLGGQIVAAGFLVLNEVRFWSLNLPGGGQFALDPTQAVLLTMLLVISTMNAVNFVDGLDGLAGGVVLIGAVAFFLFSYQLADANGETLAITAAMLCAALGGACLGFLPHNFFPARIFMGDSGSMLLGLVLSGSALTLTGQFATVSVKQGGGEGWFVMLLPDPAADLDPDRPAGGPRSGRRTTNPARPGVLPAGQGAPAPPAARDRAQPATGSADHVPLGRPDRLRRRADQPLLRPDHLGGARRGHADDRRAHLHPAARAAPGRGSTRGPSRPLTGPAFLSARDFVLFFTRPPQDDDPTRPPMMTTPSSSRRFSVSGKRIRGGFLAPQRCGSFARSASGTAAVNDQRSRCFRQSGNPPAEPRRSCTCHMGDEHTENTLRGRDLAGLGGILVAGVVGGMVIGLVIDEQAGTTPVGVLIGIAVGVVAGAAASWFRVRTALRN